MKAMVLDEYGRGLVQQELPEPSPGPRDVRLEVDAAALCGSDLFARSGGYSKASGRFPALAPPLVLGHQISGRVVEIGTETEGVSVGDRVVVYCYLFCGRCKRCLEGRQNLCERISKRIGFEVPGGFADQVIVPDRNVFPAPAGMPAERASVLPDAVTTSYHAIVGRGKVLPHEKVLVFGIGALGLYAVRLAALRGAHVVAVDQIDDERLVWARRFGAASAFAWGAGISPSRTLLDRIRGALDGPADVVVDLVGSTESLAAAPEVLAAGGRLVLVGVAARSRVALAPLAANGIRLVTSLASTPADLIDVLELAARGEVQPVVGATFQLGAVNEAMESLSAGAVVGRVVVFPGSR